MTVQDPTTLKLPTVPRVLLTSILSLLRGLYTVSSNVITFGTSTTGVKAAWFDPTTSHNFISGLIASNGTDATNDLDFSAGGARDSTNAYTIYVSTGFTKRADATWAAGTAAGMHPGGSCTAWGAATFHLFALGKSSDPTAYDFGMDSSVTAANLMANAAVVAAGFNIYRRVGSYLTGGAAWPGATPTEMGGGAVYVGLKVRVTSLNGYSAATTRQILVVSVPLGIQVFARLYVLWAYASGAGIVWVDDTEFTDAVAAFPNDDAQAHSASMRGSLVKDVRTNTSGQVAHRQDTTRSSLYIATQGYTDMRR